MSSLAPIFLNHNLPAPGAGEWRGCFAGSSPRVGDPPPPGGADDDNPRAAQLNHGIAQLPSTLFSRKESRSVCVLFARRVRPVWGRIVRCAADPSSAWFPVQSSRIQKGHGVLWSMMPFP